MKMEGTLWELSKHHADPPSYKTNGRSGVSCGKFDIFLRHQTENSSHEYSVSLPIDKSKILDHSETGLAPPEIGITFSSVILA